MTEFKTEFANYAGPQHEQAGEKEAYVEQMFDQVSPTYDVVNRLMSGGLDVSWRRRIIKESGIGEGGEILDECSGTGDVLFEFEKKIPKLRGVGYDFSAKMLEVAEKKNKNPNFKFIKGSVLELPFEAGRFDAVTMSYGLRSITDIPLCFREQARVLKSGGRALCLELSRPGAWWARAIYWPILNLYLPLVGRLVSGHNSGYTYLRDTIKGFFPPAQITAFMQSAGLVNCRRVELMFGVATIYIGDKP
jgi:demethylmenaquinone methyltransferase/2-methoxy-6-polyprenyl-1,4-benzoquinol methylase